MGRQRMDERKKVKAVRRIREAIEKAREIASEIQEDTIGSLLDSALEAIQWVTTPPPRSFDGFMAGYFTGLAKALADKQLKGTPLHEALDHISDYFAEEHNEESGERRPGMIFGDRDLPDNCGRCGMRLSDSNPYKLCYGCQRELIKAKIEESDGRVNVNSLLESYKRNIPAQIITGGD